MSTSNDDWAASDLPDDSAASTEPEPDEPPILDWRTEAEAVCADVRRHVAAIHIAGELESSRTCIYLNVTTLEGERRTIQLSGTGFRVVGRAHNNVTDIPEAEVPGQNTYETPYALLSAESPRFVRSFGDVLSEKLMAMEKEGRDGSRQ